MIFVNEPDLNGNEIKYLRECIETNWISSEGPFVKKFESLFAQKVQRKYAMAVTNGSVALDLALEAIGITKGDEVILPAFTIISPAASVVKLGAKPVLVDSSIGDWNMDINQIESKINNKTKAIIVVHIYGLPVKMKAVIELAVKHGIKVIEDAAEMHGQTYNNEPCGSFGDISTFSFYPNKLITTGEGGMVVTNNDEIAKKIRSLRNLCFNSERRFVHHEIGTNARFTNLQAAVGLAQLERLDEFVDRKREMGRYYTSQLKEIESLHMPPDDKSYSKNIFWVYGLLIDQKCELNNISAAKHLSKMDIQTRPFFYPMHQQPVFKKMGLFKDEKYPIAEYMSQKGFYIPSGLLLTKEQMRVTINALKKLFN